MSNFFHNIKIKFGYPSNHDFETWEFDLCEDCIEKIVSRFLFVPHLEEYLEI